MTTGTDAPKPTQRLVREFETFAGNGASGAPAWLDERRRDGIARFAEAGFPSTREEAWRFTSVAPIADTDFAPSPPAEAHPDDVALHAVGSQDARVVAVFVNGRFAPTLSSLDGLPEGVQIGSLAEAIERDDETVREHLARYARVDANPFTALNTAFMQDGAFVHLGPDVLLTEPIQLVFLTRPGSDGPCHTQVRNLLVAERGAQATVIETWAGPADSVYWTNAVTEIVVAENANLDTFRIQRESEQAFHTATTQTRQDRTSILTHIPFVFGSALTRHDINAVLDGVGAECTVNGLLVLHGRQHVDHHTTLEHAEPHCNSWEFFNGVYDERAHGVFNGRIIVRQKAQRTDSKQTNNSLLLSEHARADSQPQLEIYADDVRCTHGATLGPIEPKALFYLRSRGLSETEARQLLTYGFASEILNYVSVDALRDRLDAIVTERLTEAAGRRTAG